jgi:hypothetical protein
VEDGRASCIPTRSRKPRLGGGSVLSPEMGKGWARTARRRLLMLLKERRRRCCNNQKKGMWCLVWIGAGRARSRARASGDNPPVYSTIPHQVLSLRSPDAVRQSSHSHINPCPRPRSRHHLPTWEEACAAGRSRRISCSTSTCRRGTGSHPSRPSRRGGPRFPRRRARPRRS